MQQVRDMVWTSPAFDAFCGHQPSAIEEYIEDCRKRNPEELPKGAFVWYLHKGPMVTFFTPRRGGMITPADIKHRFLMPWADYENVIEYTGNYDQLLSELSMRWWNKKPNED